MIDLAIIAAGTAAFAGLAGWSHVLRSMDLGNSAGAVFGGQAVHFSIGCQKAAVAINLTTRQVLVVEDGEIEIYPFQAIAGVEAGGFPTTSPRVAPQLILVRLRLAGRARPLDVYPFGEKRGMTNFEAWAGRKRATKWIGRLHQAAREGASETVWGAVAPVQH